MESQPIALIGGTGFIGRHLLEALHDRPIRVLVHRDQPSWLSGCPQADPIPGDVFDPPSLDRLLRGCGTFINLTGQVGGTANHYLDVNLRGTLNLAQACLRHGIRRVIHTSSALVYGDALNAAEDAPCQPISPYAAMKCAAEAIMDSLLGSTTQVVSLRLSNVYGPAQAKGLIPYLVDCIRNRRRITIDADGAQVRDFVYVADVADAFVKAAAAPHCDRILNIGSGVPTSVMTLLRLIEEVLETTAIGQYCPEHTGGERRNTVSIERAAAVLDWRARTTLESGLRTFLIPEPRTLRHEVAA